jgi:hypothetical protein
VENGQRVLGKLLGEATPGPESAKPSQISAESA